MKTSLFKKTWAKTWALLLDTLEIYIPIAAFVIMLGVFILQIFFRYVLNNPLTWPYEVTIFGYIWTCVLGASFARRHNAHVSFTTIYERLVLQKQLIVRLVGNIVILVAFCIALYPCYDYIDFLKVQRTTVLRLPYNVVYFPFLVFLILIIGHTLSDIVTDLRKLAKFNETH